MSRANLRRRINALNSAINPANSIGAKLATLTNGQCAAYEDWRDRCATYYAQNPGGTAYARLLSGEQPPPLRPDVRKTLFGPTIAIPIDTTGTQAAETYRRLAHGN